jgi:hypothetical protein
MASGEQQGTRDEEDSKLVGKRRRGGTRRASDPAELSAAFQEARRSVQATVENLRDRVEERPLQTLAIALGAGYVVGGGLFSALTGRLLYGGLRIGLRLAALPLVREELMGFVENMADRGRGETERRTQ